MDSKYWQRWAVFAIACSLCIHAMLLVGMRHLSYQAAVLQSQKLIDRSRLAKAAAESKQVKREEIVKRTQELATIFHALTSSVDEKSDPLQADLESSQTIAVETHSPAISFGQAGSFQPMDLPAEIMPPLDLAALPSPMEVNLDAAPHQADLKPPKLNHQAFAEELMLATQPMFGAIVAEVAEPLASADSLTIGGLETTPLQGNAFKERIGLSGQALHDFAELEIDSRQLLMSTVDMQNLKQVLLKGSQQFSLGIPFPMQNSQRFITRVLGGHELAGHDPAAESSGFTCKIDYAPKRDLTGYLFRLELIPKEAHAFRRIPQNYIFLIDRSPSIGRQRYELTKQAVIEALDLLQDDDSFNILVFDDRVKRFSPHGKLASGENRLLAKQFMAAQKPAGVFTSTNLSSTLAQILTMEASHNKVNTAILLSDGDTFLSSTKQRKTVAGWTQANKGKVALFSLPAGRGNNLPLLELLSTFNRGMLFYAPSEQGISQTLAMLLYGIQNPISKDMMATATLAEGSSGRVELLPSPSRLPNMYAQIPYVLYGSINKLEDFHLFLQGWNQDHMISLKEHISFDNGNQVAASELERAWAIQQAYELYLRFLRDGQPQHLTVIKRLLLPYKIAMAFQ